MFPQILGWVALVSGGLGIVIILIKIGGVNQSVIESRKENAQTSVKVDGINQRLSDVRECVAELKGRLSNRTATAGGE